jgi:hypothetical protein
MPKATMTIWQSRIHEPEKRHRQVEKEKETKNNRLLFPDVL